MVEDHIRKEKITRLVKYYFSDEEKRMFGEQLADAHARRSGAQNELDTLKKQIAARITQEDGVIAEQVEKIRSGCGVRWEPCTVVKNFQACSVVVTRDSTGEILESRTMTSEESQMPLFDHQGEAMDDMGDETEEAVDDLVDAEWDFGPEQAKEGTGPMFQLGKAYNVTVQGLKRKKKNYKDLVYKETKEGKADADNARTAHIFEDAAGRTQILDDGAICSVSEAVGNAG